LSFPYTFVDYIDCIGYIEFSENTNVEGKSFTCSAILSSPELQVGFTKNETAVTIELTLLNEDFNPISTPVVKDEDGTEIVLTAVETVEIDNYIRFSFNITENHSGVIFVEIEDAYDIVLSDSSVRSVTIKTSFHI
jgi:hypothetical protein